MWKITQFLLHSTGGKGSNFTSSTIYAAVGIELRKREGRLWRNTSPANSNDLAIPAFMDDLEKTILGRVDGV